ncbi:hypothetical protein CK1_23030 [Ruminococcus sp. SR1/5]|nr:tetratricopeptide repeat protein [Ruminococcus sp. SR1/5]CBL20280.1 hypothetical protein CK1_23030 [Ruminococcus sp. SR1/5]
MKKTKTVLILAAVTGALLLGGCGSEKTKIYEQAGKDLSQGSYKYALEEYQSSIQNGVKLAQSYRGAGIASLRLGKYEDAVNSFTEALNCDKVSKSLRKDILSYRATAELKSGKYEDAMADCQTLGEDFSMDAGSYFLTGKVALAMDSYEEAASNFKQAYGEDSTYDMAIEIYEAYLDKDMEADGTRYLEAALSSEAKDAQDHCDRGRVYYYMEDYSNAKKSFWKQPRRIIRKHCFFWEWYIWPRMMWKMLRQCTSSIFPQWVIPPRAIMVWHCAISEAEIMIPLLITSQKAFRQLPQTRCRVFCSMRS